MSVSVIGLLYCRLQCDSTLSESSVNDIRRKVHEAVALNKTIYNLYSPVSLCSLQHCTNINDCIYVIILIIHLCCLCSTFLFFCII